MKKIIAIALAMVTTFSCSMMALAANTTTLTTTVPDASYELIIPITKVIEFGSEEASIGSVTVKNAAGFAEGKNLKVSVTHDDFACANVSTTIPYKLEMRAPETGHELNLETNGKYLVFRGYDDGTVSEYPLEEMTNKVGSYHKYLYMYLTASSSSWAKALAGDYTSVITFNAEVVVE